VFTRLNGKNVAFGQVIEGMDIIELMDSQGAANGAPQVEITIEGCGVL